MPGRIVPADECHPLSSPPRLDLFFASNCIAHISERLEVNQAVNPVLAREGLDQALLVLPNPAL